MNRTLCTVGVLVSCLLLAAPCACAQGQISGVASLTAPDGRTLYADWLRVLLVRSAAPLPAVPKQLESMDKFARIEATRNLHMTFFVSVRANMTDPDYVVRSTLTTPDGTFQFSGVQAGSYVILVTFPAMIRDYKVAWQVPVSVLDGQTVQVDLNSGNLALPTYSRE